MLKFRDSALGTRHSGLGTRDSGLGTWDGCCQLVERHQASLWEYAQHKLVDRPGLLGARVQSRSFDPHSVNRLDVKLPPAENKWKPTAIAAKVV